MVSRGSESYIRRLIELLSQKHKRAWCASEESGIDSDMKKLLIERKRDPRGSLLLYGYPAGFLTKCFRMNPVINFLETRLIAKRHLSKREIENLVNTIKSSIQAGNYEVIERSKNLEYAKSEGLNTPQDIATAVSYFLSQDAFRSVVTDRNKESDELYVFSVRVRKGSSQKKIYIKVSVDKQSHFVRIISFHNQESNMYADYTKAKDYEDDSLQQLFALKWETAFNRIARKYRITDYQVSREPQNGYLLAFTLKKEEEGSLSSADTFYLKNVLLRSFPQDMGYYDRMIQNSFSFGEDTIFVKLPELSYED